MATVCVIALALAISKSNVLFTLDDQGDQDGLFRPSGSQGGPIARVPELRASPRR